VAVFITTPRRSLGPSLNLVSGWGVKVMTVKIITNLPLMPKLRVHGAHYHFYFMTWFFGSKYCYFSFVIIALEKVIDIIILIVFDKLLRVCGTN
jgi:hypothetical protein